MNKEIYKIHVLDSSDNRIYYYSIKTFASNLGEAIEILLLSEGHDIGQSLYITVKEKDIVDNFNNLITI